MRSLKNYNMKRVREIQSQSHRTEKLVNSLCKAWREKKATFSRNKLSLNDSSALSTKADLGRTGLPFYRGS